MFCLSEAARLRISGPQMQLNHLEVSPHTGEEECIFITYLSHESEIEPSPLDILAL